MKESILFTTRCRWTTAGSAALLTFLAGMSAAHAASATLDRIRDAGKLALGYQEDARPFSYSDAGKPVGYAISLCELIAERIKAELNKPDLQVQWVPVQTESAIPAIQRGSIDMVCGAATSSLSARRDVSFSIPIFPSGVGAVLNASADVALREILSNNRPITRPIWRGTPARTIIEQARISVVENSRAQKWLAERLDTLQIPATVEPVKSYDEGIQQVLSDRTRVLFGALPILLDAAKRSQNSSQLVVLDRHFTREPLALAFARNDEDFRLLVDQTLSRIFTAGDFAEIYASWFGPPNERTVTFFQSVALPE